MFTYAIVGFSALCVVGGFLFGLIRGFNRSLLRLILVAVSVALAWFLRGVIVNLILKINIQGKTIEQFLTDMLVNNGASIPDSVTNLVFVLVQIIASVICFILLFFLLRFITWSLIYPFLKLVVRKGAKKRALLGGVIGLLQGVLVAFVLCVPVTGIAGQLNTMVTAMSEVKVNGEALVPAEVSSQIESIGINDYQNSALGKFYIKTGGGLYNKMTSAKDRNGNNVSLESAIKALSASAKVANSLSDAANADFSQGITAENKDALVSALRTIDDVQKNELSDEDAKRIVNELITGVVEAAGGSEGGEGDFTLPENFDIGKLEAGAAADAVEAIYGYTERMNDETKTDEEKQLTQEEAAKIVNGIAKNEEFITSITGSDTSLVGDISEEDKTTMTAEIEKLKTDGTINDETAASLKKLLGITATSPSGEGGAATGGESAAA